MQPITFPQGSDEKISGYYSQPQSAILPPSTQPGQSPRLHPYPLSGSPAHNPYLVPIPNGYPNPSPHALPPAPGQHGYQGAPPYPVYPPYIYGYGQPYAYWNPNGQEQPQPVPYRILHPSDDAYRHNPTSTDQVASANLPPPTMMVRPPPPDESEAVAGYRDVGLVLPASVNQSKDVGEVEPERGRRTRSVEFGSLSGSASPSPARFSAARERVIEPSSLGLDLDGSTGGNGGSATSGGRKEVDEKPSKTFSVGVAPGEFGPSHPRSRTRSKARRRVETAPGRFVSDVTDDAVRPLEEIKEMKMDTRSLIDLTGPEAKWEFGTTSAREADSTLPPPSQASAISSPGSGLQQLPRISPTPGTITTPVLASGGSPGPLVGTPVSIVLPPPYPYRASAPITPEARVEPDEWEVKDFGYGFGPMSGTGYGPVITRQARDQGRVDRGREAREQEARDRDRDQDFNGRPRRPSNPYYPNFGYDRGGGRSRGRGFGGRGYAPRGFGRGFQQPPRPPPFTVTPPPHLQVLPPENATTYYAPPLPMVTYIPAYEAYHPVPFPPAQSAPSPAQPPPPLPVPLSPLDYPLDHTRYYLLGQLEYYMSAQNMAQDFYLRQQMDSQGWISITLIASFNRIKQLTMDLRLVREVLSLSKLVEVQDEWVRMSGGQWRQFVLPGAPRSVFEYQTGIHAAENSEPPYRGTTEAEIEQEHGQYPEGEGEGDLEDEDEEDVVFVLGHEAHAPWGTEPQTA
ncbi:hypothetical protein JAAARDRAFT_56179 [Jaapia argillacea MUCL 33604]|uniref:HTH La-type RNA-binding domain-containing protein n=1 Tax=Jaapia argillacea MUCL 33604 TaxID=933084 RepID=A0A067PZK1_9AGAM|nr:hypothetical protein JAAARDRAFT_56179 [Jaapia argillacea MUCL 33604]